MLPYYLGLDPRVNVFVSRGVGEEGAPQGAHCALCPDPRVLNSASYSPCWYIRDFFCFSLMLATGPRVVSSAAPTLF